jgi:hypothetical protein
MVISFSNKALADVPGRATLLAPEGTCYDDNPTYAWYAVPGATKYRIILKDDVGSVVLDKMYSAWAAGCTGNTALCSVTPNKGLDVSSYRWWIRPWNPEGYGPWRSLSFEVKGHGRALIKGTYAFTGMEQGGAPYPSAASVVQEAAMGIVYTYGTTGTGKITWNMYDYGEEVAGDRLVLHRFPFSMEYSLGFDGFGNMTGLIDFDIDGVNDAEITGNIVATKTYNTEVLEFWFIGENPLAEGMVIIHFFKREQ